MNYDNWATEAPRRALLCAAEEAVGFKDHQVALKKFGTHFGEIRKSAVMETVQTACEALEEVMLEMVLEDNGGSVYDEIFPQMGFVEEEPFPEDYRLLGRDEDEDDE